MTEEKYCRILEVLCQRIKGDNCHVE